MTDSNQQKQAANDHLANERTLLAWVRTGIAVMAFGFVVVKFSMFIRQMAFLVPHKNIVITQGRHAPVIGIILVVIGAGSMVLAYINYKRTEQQLLNKNYRHSSGLLLALVAVIFIMSIFLIAYLIQNISE